MKQKTYFVNATLKRKSKIFHLNYNFHLFEENRYRIHATHILVWIRNSKAAYDKKITSIWELEIFQWNPSQHSLHILLTSMPRVYHWSWSLKLIENKIFYLIKCVCPPHFRFLWKLKQHMTFLLSISHYTIQILQRQNKKFFNSFQALTVPQYFLLQKE